MEEEIQHRPYRIMEGDTVTIIRQDAEKDGNKWVFYKVALHNKKDDTQVYYKYLVFPKGVELKDGDRIKINKMVEYARHLDKYRDTFYLYIVDYEKVYQKPVEAYSEYQQDTSNGDDFLF